MAKTAKKNNRNTAFICSFLADEESISNYLKEVGQLGALDEIIALREKNEYHTFCEKAEEVLEKY